MSKGYLFLAFGKYYVEELIGLVRTIRKTGDELPASVICTSDDYQDLVDTKMFDKVIVHKFDHELYNEPNITSFERNCLIPRLLFNKLLVYDETIITDTDMVCQYNPSNVWKLMSSLDQAVVMTGRNYSPDWHFGFNWEVSDHLGKNVPESHGGIFYINRNHKDLDKFFEMSIEVYNNYDGYKLRRMFRGGRVDEPIFAIVNALLDYKVLEFGEAPIITFNYDGDDVLPSKVQTFGAYKSNNSIELNDYIPFVHMFRPHKHHHIKLLKRLLGEKKYTILGCITKYGVEDIKPYVESIRKSGFDGDKLMLCYDIPEETIKYLDKNGWLLIEGRLQEHIILQRFRDVYALLHQYDTDVIIWTDVKDVVFQKNPTEWIEQNIGDKDILAFSECVRLRDDSWAVMNSGTSFPMEWELGLKDEISYCAGTIVGKKNAIRDLFIDIYRWSKTTANPEQLSDQAAYNALLRLHQYSRGVDLVAQERGFITQLGTVWIKRNVLPITEPTPIFKDGKFYNQTGQEFCIVHQYDRDPLLKQQIYERYN